MEKKANDKSTDLMHDQNERCYNVTERQNFRKLADQEEVLKL